MFINDLTDKGYLVQVAENIKLKDFNIEYSAEQENIKENK